MVRYRRIYDSAIVFYLRECSDANGPIPQSFTDIYEKIVRSLNPKVGKDTIQRHLNKLIEGQWIMRLPKEGQGRRYNKTLYILSPKGKAWLERVEATHQAA